MLSHIGSCHIYTHKFGFSLQSSCPFLLSKSLFLFSKMGTLNPIVTLKSILIVVVFIIKSSTGKTVYHKFEVSYMFGAPDCVENIVMSINGKFPGPTIRASAGDTVHVDLTNNLYTEGVVIHWHGIRQVLFFIINFINLVN